MTSKIIYIASDHRGFSLKTSFIKWLKEEGYEVHDIGPDTDEHRVDATDYAVRVATSMRNNALARAILICGTGQAMAMSANRFKHIRAALCTDTTMTRLAREHNDANVLALGSGIVGEEVAFDCLRAFLSTEALGGRYAERCQILTELGGL